MTPLDPNADWDDEPVTIEIGTVTPVPDPIDNEKVISLIRLLLGSIETPQQDESQKMQIGFAAPRPTKRRPRKRVPAGKKTRKR